MTTATLRNVGNSVAVVTPKQWLSVLGLAAGEKVEMKLEGDRLTMQAKAWSLPEPVEGSSHLYKYRLFYGYSGKRVIGYDNERGKGDHKHYHDTETPYSFTTPEQVWRDFVTDILTERGKP